MYSPNKPTRSFELPPIPDLSGWVVQFKYDGDRAIVHCDGNGHVHILSRHLRPLGTIAHRVVLGHWKWLSMLDIPRPWILDGELTPTERLIIWDTPLWGGEDWTTRTYADRLVLLQLTLKQVQKGTTALEVIKTLPAKRYKELLLRHDPDAEGLVFKSVTGKDFWGFKTREVGSQIKYRFQLEKTGEDNGDPDIA